MKLTLGTSVSPFGEKPFEIDVSPKQFRHGWVLGKTGTGKSTLLKHFIVDAIRSGIGIAVLDPHGDLIYDCLPYIPPSRLKDLYLLDPEKSPRMPGLGVLDYPNKRQALRILMTQIEAHSGPTGWGKQSATIFRNVFRCALERFKRPSAIHIHRLLSDDDYAIRQFEKCKDWRTHIFYKAFFVNMQKRDRIAAFSHPLNKWEEFVEDDLVEFFGQEKSMNFRKLMDEKKILFCRIPKSFLEERAARLLGSFLMMKFKVAAPRRKKRKNQFLIVADEFHNFIEGIDVDTMLGESRKYGTHYLMASQTRRQLKDAADVIAGNCSHIFAFRLHANDAKVILENLGDNDDFYPQLVKMKNFTFRALYMDDDEPIPSEPVALYRAPPLYGDEVPARKAAAWAMQNTGTPKKEIQKIINKALAD